MLRVPLADGTLVATPEVPPDDLLPGLLTTSDVLGTGWFAADAAKVQPGSTVVVVGDGAVGLFGVLSARQLGAARIFAMSRHEDWQKLARDFGATDIIAERGDDGVARILDLTDGIGADSVLECVGTQEAMMQAVHVTRPGGYVGYVAPRCGGAAAHLLLQALQSGNRHPRLLRIESAKWVAARTGPSGSTPVARPASTGRRHLRGDAGARKPLVLRKKPRAGRGRRLRPGGEMEGSCTDIRDAHLPRLPKRSLPLHSDHRSSALIDLPTPHRRTCALPGS